MVTYAHRQSVPITLAMASSCKEMRKWHPYQSVNVSIHLVVGVGVVAERVEVIMARMGVARVGVAMVAAARGAGGIRGKRRKGTVKRKNQLHKQ